MFYNEAPLCSSGAMAAGCRGSKGEDLSREGRTDSDED